MSFLGLTGLVNLLTSTTLGIVCLIKVPQKRLRYAAFLANLSIAIFSLGYMMWQLTGDAATTLFWFRITVIGIILINPTFIHFVFVFTEIIDRKKTEIISNYLLSGIFALLSLSPGFYTSLEPRFGLGFWPVPTALFTIYLVFWFAQGFYGWYWLLKSLRKAKGHHREQIKYFVAGLAAAFVGGASNWPMWYSYNIPPYANIAVSLYVVSATYAIIRYHLMDISIILTRAGIFLLIYTFILGIPLYLGYRYNFNESAFMALFAMATVGPVLYQVVHRKAENVLLSKQRAYQGMFLRSAREFMRERDLRKIISIIVNGVKYEINTEFAGLFLVDRDNGVYRLEYIKGNNFFPVEFCMSLDDPLISILNEKKKVLTYQELPVSFHQYTPSPVQIVVPSFLDDELLGFIMIGNKNDQTMYNKDDISTFEIIAHQSALAIENCMYLAEKEKVQERLFLTEKSAFIGGMAEGVAHQINNRLNQFSFATAEIDMVIRGFESSTTAECCTLEYGEFISQLRQIQEQIIDNVKRTNGVIKGVINYANLVKRDDLPADLFFDEVIEAAIDLVRVKHEIDEFPIQIEVIGSSNIIYGKINQILESLFNVIANAYEAIQEKSRMISGLPEYAEFHPGIRIRLKQTSNYSHIEISDNGIGIREEDRKKIFAPYYTTKSSYKEFTGSGISLYEVSRFIQEHHRGRIWFTSEYMKGTTFYIELPHKFTIMEMSNSVT